MNESNQIEVDISAAKRVGLGNYYDWGATNKRSHYVWSDNPRNGAGLCEGNWCHWVELAQLILSHPMTAKYLPDLHQSVPDDQTPHADTADWSAHTAQCAGNCNEY